MPWNDRLQKHLALHERDKVCVVIDVDDEDALARIPSLVQMLQHIQQVSSLYVKNNRFKRDPSFLLELLVLLVVPRETFHGTILSHCVPFVNESGKSSAILGKCPKSRQSDKISKVLGK